MELYESLEPAISLPEEIPAQEMIPDATLSTASANADGTAAIPCESADEPEGDFSANAEAVADAAMEAGDVDDAVEAEDSAPLSRPIDEPSLSAADAPAEAVTETAMVRVKFNKQEHTLTVEQAAPLVEMGMKWEQFRTHHEKLRYLAQEGGQSVGALIDSLLEQNDAQALERLREECGGSEAAAAKLLAIQQAERQRLFDQAGIREEAESRLEAEQEQAALEQRLADEFVRLTEEMPGQFDAFTDVPPAVVDIAVRSNVSLMDAYLRYTFYEQRRAEAVRERQAQSAGRSAGSLGCAGHMPEPEMDSFERAFHTALR